MVYPYALSNLIPLDDLSILIFCFQTIKLWYEISNFTYLKMKFNTPDCLVENTAV